MANAVHANPLPVQSPALATLAIDEILPHEILCYIFSFARASELQGAVIACTRFRAAVLDRVSHRANQEVKKLSEIAIARLQPLEEVQVVNNLMLESRGLIRSLSLRQIRHDIHLKIDQFVNILAACQPEIEPQLFEWNDQFSGMQFFGPVSFLIVQKQKIQRAQNEEDIEVRSAQLSEIVAKYYFYGYYSEAIELAKRIPLPTNRERSFESLFYFFVSIEKFDLAIDCFGQMSNRNTKERALSHLVRRFAEKGRYTEALDLVSLANPPIYGNVDYPKNSLLETIINECLKNDKYDQALEVAALIQDDGYKFKSIHGILNAATQNKSTLFDEDKIQRILDKAIQVPLQMPDIECKFSSLSRLENTLKASDLKALAEMVSEQIEIEKVHLALKKGCSIL